MSGRQKSFVALALVVLLGLAGLVYYQIPHGRPGLRVLCGSSMSVPIEEARVLFETGHGPIAIDLGGSETLLPRVLTGAAADVFVCHDPFEEKVRQAGLLAGSVEVGVLRPVLLVAPGNPRGIHSVQDLSRAGLKIGIGDPRYSTCGEMFVDLLKRKGMLDAVMRNVVFQGRSHGEIANGLVVGSLDAVVVWNYVARLYGGKVELIPTADEYPAIRVTVLGLSKSARPDLRDAFLELCRGRQVQEIFQKYGYGAHD